MPDRLTPTSVAFLKRLLTTPGPSGFEAAAARTWREEVEGFADRVTVDVAGNSFAAVNPEGRPRIMLTGHIDEIGFMVTHVDDDGFLYFQPIGGWDSQVVVGQRVQVLTARGPVVGGVGKRAIHLMKKEERDKVSQLDDLWIDIGAASKKEALRRVAIGDAAVLLADVHEFPNGRIVSRSVDNRIGAFVAAEALRIVARSRKKPAAAVYAVATTQEEIAYTGGGARSGSTGLEPDAAIVVDVTHATDYPGADKRKQGEHRLGGGPVLTRGSSANPKVFALLQKTAEREKIPYTVQAAPIQTSTDADAIATAARGIATGLVSVPNRYMHSPNEMVAAADLARVARLLAAFALAVGPKTDFRPS
jgi:endoglucanase